MQRYEAYKPSGVDWLGDIPANWDVCRNIGLFDERKEINQPDMELLSVTINRGVIRQEEITEKKDGSNEDKSKYKVVRKDDLAYNKMRMWQGAIGRSEYEGIVSPAYVILAPRDNLYSRYYHYLYRTGAFIAEANRHSYGLCLDMNSLRYEDFKTIYSPVPPRTEVERIVAFLDQKTAEIDAAIAKKERLIELIKEQKSTCIEKAITEGLEAPKNSEACLSPKHWSRIKLKYCINLLPGFAFKSSSYSSNDSDIPLLRGVNVNPGKLNWEDKVSWPKASLAPHLKYMLEPGDLVIGMDRPWVADGIRVAPVQACDLPCLLLQRVARLRAANRITQEFLALVLTSRGFLTYFEPMLTGISVPHISPEQIGNYEATLPPVEEQEAICKFVSQLSRFCEQAIAKETQIVNGLRQLRASVIADVVLGKRKI